MARGELPDNPETPRWGVFSATLVPGEETAELEGVNRGTVEVELIGQWYHRRYMVATQRRPIRLLVQRSKLIELLHELGEEA